MATYKDNVMEIKRLKTNPRMSQAVVYGGLLTTAGQVAKITAGGSVAEQAQEILSEIEADREECRWSVHGIIAFRKTNIKPVETR